METKQFSEAERVYRAALDRSPRLPRALAGLRDSLQAQNRLYEAQQLDEQLRNVASSSNASAKRVRISGSKIAE